MSVSLIKAPISMGAYNLGWSAYRAGIKTCPHMPDHPDHARWMEGFEAAHEYFGEPDVDLLGQRHYR